MNLKLIFPLSIILFYPFPIYALQNEISLNTIILLFLSLVGYIVFFLLNFKLSFTKLQIGCYFVIICIIMSLFIGKIIVNIYYPELQYSEYTASVYFISIIIFFLVLTETLNVGHVDFILKTLLLVSVLTALFIIAQFFLYLFFDFKLYPPFCSELICIDSFERSPRYGYAGGYSRPSGFFNSTNRVASYLLPAVFISLFYFKKNKSTFYLLLFFIFTTAILLNLSRTGIISLLISFFFLVLILATRNSKTSFASGLALVSFLFSVSVMVLFLFLYVVGSDLNYKFNPFFGQDFEGALSYISNLRDSVLISMDFFGFGVGYDIADEYLYQTDTTKLWGSHSNLIQMISGIGIIPTGMIIIFLLSLLYKSFSQFINEKDPDDLILFLVIAFIGMAITGVLRTYALNYYSVLIISIIYVLLVNNSKKS